MSIAFTAKLVMMANQIAAAFERQPGDAAMETARHIRAFWPQAMREAIVRHLTTGETGLIPTAREAVAALGAAASAEPRR